MAPLQFENDSKDRRRQRERDKVQRDLKSLPQQELARLIQTLEEEMHEASAELKFEYAAKLRDEIATEAYAQFERAVDPIEITLAKHYHFGHVDRSHLSGLLTFDDRLLARNSISRLAQTMATSLDARLQLARRQAA